MGRQSPRGVSLECALQSQVPMVYMIHPRFAFSWHQFSLHMKLIQALHFLSIQLLNGLRLLQVPYFPCFNPLLVKFFFYYSYCNFTLVTLRQAVTIDFDPLSYARGYVHEEARRKFSRGEIYNRVSIK